MVSDHLTDAARFNHISIYYIVDWFNADHTEARRQAAQAALDKALHLRPDLGQVHFSAAIHLFANRDYPGVQRELEIAQQTMPNSARLLGLMAVAQARQGQWRDAIEDINRALTLDPKNFSLMIIRFDFYLYHRRYDGLRRLYQEASEAGMDSVSVDFNRAEAALWERGDTSLFHGLLAGPGCPLKRDWASHVAESRDRDDRQGF